jgi:murein DD-endopeptidase MepM/ murein hydrolase activator NlpD
LKSLLKVIALIVLIGLITVSEAVQSAHAQQTVVVNPEFEFIRQGSVGIVTLSGSGIVGGVVKALDRTYPFFPVSKGYAALLSVPMETKILDYPYSITLMLADGSTAEWQGSLKVAAGQFVNEQPYALPSEKVYLLSDQIQQSEDAKLHSAFGMLTPTKYWEGRFSLPVNGAITAPFGSWRTYNGGVHRRHTGQDFRAAAGTPVLASASGRVVLARPFDIHGNSIVIDHGWGIFSGYSHASIMYVVPGQYVLQGDVIGLSGNTGRSTGPHVHFEIAVNGIWVDPVSFIETKLPN